jgi:DNA repair protein RadD
MSELRPYQKTCVEKMLWGLQLPGNGLIVVPTGGGKTHIISEFTNRHGKPVLILVPSKELLEQDYEKLAAVVDPKEIGIYSASMNSKEVKKYTLATIQSAYKHPEQFAHYEVVIIDEADLVNPKNLQGMYNTFFKAIGNPKVIGLTATPFRLDSYYRRWGRLSWQVETVTTIKFLTRYKERFWDRVLHVVDIDELLENNWLTPLTYHDKTMIPQEKLRFNKSHSEFNLEDFEEKYIPFLDQTANLISNMKEKSVLVFCATISQAESLQEKIPGSELVSGSTPKKLRAGMIERFRSGETRVILNVGVLLVGFDKPNLEAIVIARPTRSLRLHLQLLGRGMRVFPGKETCNIYDLVGNVAEMGKAETFKIEKVANAQGTQLWNITSETKPEGWHYAELYSHKLHKSDPKEEPVKKPRKQSVFSQPGDIREQLKTNWS